MKISSKIYERYCVVTEMLTKLGDHQMQAEIDACEIEYVISEETFEKMKGLCKTMNSLIFLSNILDIIVISDIIKLTNEQLFI